MNPGKSKQRNPEEYRLLVSVITAAYNSQTQVALAVASICLQQGVEWEMLVVDDGSTDQTARVVAGLACNESRVRLVYHARNLGRAEARNRAIRESKGEYIAVLDADDLAMPGRLASQAAYLSSHPHSVLVGGWALRVDHNLQPIDKVITTGSPSALRQQLVHTGAMPFVHSSVMFRRTALEKAGLYDPRFIRSQDVHFCRRVGVLGEVGALPQIVALYTVPADTPMPVLRDKYRWSARAAWDFVRHHRSLPGVLNAAKQSLMGVLPETVLRRVSGLHRKRVPPTPEETAAVHEWIETLEGWVRASTTT